MNKKVIVVSALVGVFFTVFAPAAVCASDHLTAEDIKAIRSALGSEKESILGGTHLEDKVKSDIVDDHPHYRVFTAIRNAGWHQGPSAMRWMWAFVWSVGPLAVNAYVTSRLKRDKEARLLQLRKEQSNNGINPLAQLLMQMQRGNMGADEGDGLSAGIELPDSAEKPDEKVLEWNPDDILTPSKRRFFQALSWIATALSIIGVVNAYDTAKDAWKGNQMPSAVWHIFNKVNRGGQIEASFADKIEEYANLPKRSMLAAAGEIYAPLATLARERVASYKVVDGSSDEAFKDETAAKEKKNN